MTPNEERGISLDCLQFDLIVPRPEVTVQGTETLPSGEVVKKTQVWHYSPEEVKVFVDSLICVFLSFLTKRGSQSYYTALGHLVAILTLVEAQYHQLVEPEKMDTLPVMQKVKGHLQRESHRKKKHKPVANEDMKWLELPEVLIEIVEPLRQECLHLRSSGNSRPITAIAHSFAIFLMWGFLTLVAPRRQQEHRGMKIALECQLPRPEGIAPGRFVHPLPWDRTTNKEVNFGYLYKAKDGFWYRDMTVESYKTGGYKNHGHQGNLKVPNPSFPGGKCFYDYLEAYLYGYYRTPQGDWVSGGQTTDTPKYPGSWHNLRMAFNPSGDHRHLFVRPRTGGVYCRISFGNVVRNHAHRLTGKLLTPHFLRDIYATWFLDGGYQQLLTK